MDNMVEVMALIKYIGEEVQSKIYYIFGWEKERKCCCILLLQLLLKQGNNNKINLVMTCMPRYLKQIHRIYRRRC